MEGNPLRVHDLRLWRQGDAMTARPILFSAPMVIAILAGRKTQTRRILKHEHLDAADVFAFDASLGEWEMGECHQGPTAHVGYVKCPHGVPGDHLWVKETHAVLNVDGDTLVAYRATCDGNAFDYVSPRGDVMRLEVEKWKPSIFMPRTASRLTLELAAVRVERLHDISEADAKAEGVLPFFELYDCIGRDQVLPGGTRCSEKPYRASYEMLWEQINGAGSWLANPWVWVESFSRL